MCGEAEHNRIQKELRKIKNDYGLTVELRSTMD